MRPFPLFATLQGQPCLLVGGGDGGTVREVLRHPCVRHCTLVEIDEQVLEACRRHLPVTAAALDDPRVEVRIDDGVAHVARTDERYDLVIVDSSDPIGPAVPLFGSEFYDNVRRVLTERGMVVAQARYAAQRLGVEHLGVDGAAGRIAGLGDTHVLSSLVAGLGGQFEPTPCFLDGQPGPAYGD